jgi:L,D-transpeptidase YbiS
MESVQPMTTATKLAVSLTRQELRVVQGSATLAQFPVSTSRYGPGEGAGSYCTPRGSHLIRACIGADLPLGAVFKARRPTGEVWSPALHREFPHRDWILTRILWLSGLERGRNRLGAVDSMARYIYLHGTPDTEPMGVPFSHGCIRLRNTDMRELFGLVVPGTRVDIGD